MEPSMNTLKDRMEKEIIPHQPTVQLFQQKTNYLINEFLEENEIPESFMEADLFLHLIRHLNPLATYNHVQNMEQDATFIKDLQSTKLKEQMLSDNSATSSDSLDIETLKRLLTPPIPIQKPRPVVDEYKDMEPCVASVVKELAVASSSTNSPSSTNAPSSINTPSSTNAPNEPSQADLEFHALPTNSRPEPPCIICQAPTPTITSVLLNINDAAKILMAAVSTNAISMENASKAICGYPLRLCNTHTRSVYDMMVQTVGIRSTNDMVSADIEKLSPALEIYRTLRSIRGTMDNKPVARTQLGSFKMALRTFYKAFTPKDVLNSELKEKDRLHKMNKILQIYPSDVLVKNYLQSEAIHLNKGEELRILEAVKLKKHPHFINDKMHKYSPSASPQPAPIGDPSDLLYSTIAQRRKDARKRRYDSYPQEIRDLMKPIDEQYERQTAECRTQMKSIRQQKSGSAGESTIPEKRVKSGFENPGAKHKKPPTDYSSLAAQKLSTIRMDCSSPAVISDVDVRSYRNTIVSQNGSQGSYSERNQSEYGELEYDEPEYETPYYGPPEDDEPESEEDSIEENMLLEPKQEQEDYDNMIVPKEEPIDIGYEKKLKEQKFDPMENASSESDRNQSMETVYNYGSENEEEEVDVFTCNSPRKCRTGGGYYSK